MRNIVNIALNDLRIFFSQRGNIVGLTVIPIFLTIALGIAFGANLGGDGTVQMRVDVIDKDNSTISAEFLDMLRSANENLIVCPLDDGEQHSCGLATDISYDLETGLSRLDAGDTRAVIVIPAGFESDFLDFQPVNIVYYSREDMQSGSPVRSIVQSVVSQLNSAVVASQVGTEVGKNLGHGFSDKAAQAEFSQQIYERTREILAADPLVIHYVLTEQGEVSQNSGTGFGQSVPGIGAMQVMFTVLTGLEILVRERKQWTLQRLTAMPLRRAEILGGKILMYFVLGMIQYSILLVVGIFVGVNYGSSFFALILLVSAFVLCVTALTFAVATRVRTEEQANSFGNLLAISLAPLGGAWWPLDIVPDFMKVIGHISPVAWVMDGFKDLIFYGGGLVDILPEVAVLLAIAAVLFVIGIRGFNFGE